MQTVLTIAGFDPSSGAGVTADLMVFAAHGLFATACITALTVQSTLGVRATYGVGAEVVKETLECLDADIRPNGIKIGMLYSHTNIHIICDYLAIMNALLEGQARVPVVLDPVMRSSSGRELLDLHGVAVLRERLLPMVDWVTPNLDELAVLANRPVARRGDVADACRSLQDRVGDAWGRRLGILATGGHMDPPDDFLLTPDGESCWLPGERVETQSTHGTGCALSSSFLSRLVLGDTPRQAAEAAKLYVAGGLRAAVEIGHGRGPMKHLWPLLERGL
jgi:hydroxymethylpyrimidine/phosphomethylpyrimidine kinase